jgi:hypothetical protein
MSAYGYFIDDGNMLMMVAYHDQESVKASGQTS